MRKNFSITTALEKARIDSAVPFLAMLDIEVVNNDGVYIETLHVVCNNENVVYRGVTYAATKFDLNFAQEGNAAPSLTVSIVDYQQSLQAYMEQYAGGVGFRVTMMIVNAGALDQAPEIEEFFEVVAASAKGYITTFTLGASMETAQVFPRRQQRREFCHARYRDPYSCGYGWRYLTPLGLIAPETLTSVPRMSQMVPSANTPKQSPFCLSAYVSPFNVGRNFGLQVYNRTANSNIALGVFKLKSDGSLEIMQGGASAGWEAVPNVKGLFRVWISSATGIPAGTVDVQAVIRPASYSSDMTYHDILPIGCVQLEFGRVTPSSYVHTAAYNAAVRNKLAYSNSFDTQTGNAGDTFNVWKDTGAGLAWNRVEPKLMSEIYPAVDTDAGLDDCDMTLQGPNGCKVHNNTQRFQGFPGLNDGLMRYA